MRQHEPFQAWPDYLNCLLDFPPCWAQNHRPEPAKYEGDQVTKASLEVDSFSTREGNNTGQLYVADCSWVRCHNKYQNNNYINYTQSCQDATDCPLQKVNPDIPAVLHDEPGGHPDTAADDGACQVSGFSLGVSTFIHLYLCILVPAVCLIFIVNRENMFCNLRYRYQ